MIELLILVPLWMIFLVVMAMRTMSYLHYDNLQIDAEPEFLSCIKMLAETTGLNYRSPVLGPNARLIAQTFSLSGRLQGCPAEWALQVRMDNGNLVLHQLEVVLKPEYHLDFDLQARPRVAGKGRAASKARERSDLLTGDKEFDTLFHVATCSPDVVAQLLTFDVRKHLLDLAAEPGSKLELTQDALTFTKALRGRITSEVIADTFTNIDVIMTDLSGVAESLHDALSGLENQSPEFALYEEDVPASVQAQV